MIISAASGGGTIVVQNVERARLYLGAGSLEAGLLDTGGTFSLPTQI